MSRTRNARVGVICKSGALQGTFSKTIPTSPVASTYAGFPPDMDDWSCAQWKSYYLNNVKALGKPKALDIVNIDSENVGAFADVHYCQYNCEWSNFFKNEGLPNNNVISTIYCGATSVTTSAVNTATNTADVAANLTGAAKSFSSSNLLLLGALGLVGFGAYKIASKKLG